MFVRNRESSRGFFFDVWHKYNTGAVLEPLEHMVLGVLLEHREYHHFLQDEVNAVNLEFDPGPDNINPFLHMGMHIAIKEQVQADRPAGVRQIYSSLCEIRQDQHKVEHEMMECLGNMLWQAQLNNQLPDENVYMDCIRKLG